MASFELKNDVIATIPILTVDAAGDVVPAIAGDVFTVVASDATKIGAVIVADASGAPAVAINALVKLAPGLTITLTDADKLTPFVLDVDIVADLTPAAVSLNVSAATFAPQAVPAN